MVNNVIPTVAILFGEVLGLVDRVFTDFGGWTLFVGGFIVFLTYRFLLVPLFGGSGSSDKARKKATSTDSDD